MRKLGEKIALVAQICIAVIFVLVAVLYLVGIIPQVDLKNNAVVLVIMIVFAGLFFGLSAYLCYMNFSELQNLKRILLHADSQSSTTTTIKVVNKIARSCSDQVEGVHIKKSKIRADEKKGYTATFTVVVTAESVTPALEQLRCLVADCFSQTLGLVFNTITFEVVKLKSKPKTDVEKAKKQAEQIVDANQAEQEQYLNPVDVLPEGSDEVAEADEPIEQTEQAEEPAEVVAEESAEQPTEVDEQPAEEETV